MSKDVTLREYTDASFMAQRRLGGLAIASVLTIIVILNMSNTKATKLALDGAEKATSIAFANAKTISESHNDLIRKSEIKDSTFITRGQIYAALGTALAMLTVAKVFFPNMGG